MKYLVQTACLAAAIVGATFVNATAQQSNSLGAVKQRGQLSCGVHTGLPGFGAADDKGVWAGFDIDYCRAVAVAVLGDTSKIKYVPTTPKERFTALNSGEVDVLIRTTTWTLQRDSAQGLSFTGINYYDGQGFMVKKSLGVKRAKELAGASICVQTGTTTELNLADFFRTNNLQYKSVVFEKIDEAVAAYQAGRCDSYTTDQSGLYAARLLMQKPDDHIVLPDVISKEPLGPSVRQGDSQWFTIVKWVHFVMLNAEEAGITKANVDQMLTSTNPDIKRILGKEGDFGKGLGLDNEWAYRIIKQVGNYGEVFDRNIGASSRLKIERGINDLWTKGGLQYGPPVR
jgi:general L-amino acid transport system substrate-binding protein